jgi:hypothetical protein
MAKLLTPLAIGKMKPGKKRIEVRDGGCRGLILVIQPSGHKAWGMRFRDRTGGLVRMTLGAVDLTGENSTGGPVRARP